MLRQLGDVSPECEKYGADFLFFSGKGLIGVQRKECNDLVASLRDGRLAKELDQLGRCNRGVILVEGVWWWDGGFRGDTFGQAEWEGVEVSLQLNDMIVVRTTGIEQTVERLPRLERYFERSSHESLLRSPKLRSAPGHLRLLQSLDGVSLTRARAIHEHFRCIPLTWSCTSTEMRGVPGLGKVMVERLGAMIPYKEET